MEYTNFVLTLTNSTTHKKRIRMKKLAIGVDIGGINTAFGLVDEKGGIYAESLLPTRIGDSM